MAGCVGAVGKDVWPAPQQLWARTPDSKSISGVLEKDEFWNVKPSYSYIYYVEIMLKNFAHLNLNKW